MKSNFDDEVEPMMITKKEIDYQHIYRPTAFNDLEESFVKRMCEISSDVTLTESICFATSSFV